MGGGRIMLTLFLQNFETEEDKIFFTEIYTKYENYLLKVATDKLYDNSYVSDCIQDTFLELVHSFEIFKGIQNENSQKAYLITICKRCAFKINNKADNNCISIEDVSDEKMLKEESYIYREEDISAITDIICNMDEKYREPLMMKYLEGYSILEISERLGISETTVKQRLFRGRKQINDSLRMEYKL